MFLPLWQSARKSATKVYLPCQKNFPQNCVFYRMEIHRTVLKQPIRIEYLIKQKPRGALALQVNRIADNQSKIYQNKYISLPNNKNASIVITVFQWMSIYTAAINCHINLKSCYVRTPVQFYHLVLNHIYIHSYILQLPPSYVRKYNRPGGLSNCFRLLSLCSYALQQFVMASEVRQT